MKINENEKDWQSANKLHSRLMWKDLISGS